MKLSLSKSKPSPNFLTFLWWSSSTFIIVKQLSPIFFIHPGEFFRSITEPTTYHGGHPFSHSYVLHSHSNFFPFILFFSIFSHWGLVWTCFSSWILDLMVDLISLLDLVFAKGSCLKWGFSFCGSKTFFGGLRFVFYVVL